MATLDQPKSSFRSLTIIAAAVAAAVSFAGAAGYQIAPETGQDINQILAGIAAAFAIYGRIRATKRIG